MCIDSSLHEVGYGDARYLHRILERKEESGPSPFFRTHGQKILSEELHCTGSNSKLRLACKNSRKRALTCTVRSHHRMNLTLADDQIHAFQDFLILNRGPEALYFQKYIVCHNAIFFLNNRCITFRSSVPAVQPVPAHK